MQRGLSAELSHIWRKLSGQRATARRRAKTAFWQAISALKPGDLAIDLGANVGEFTLAMAKTGADVHAFEPDPHALDQLRAATAGHANVSVHPVAVGTAAGTATLYRATWFARDPDRGSKSSSLFSTKRNIDTDHGLDIEIIDFPAFLAALESDIALIKMDIEGAEVPLLETLPDTPVATRIGKIFVETHERALPDLAPRIAELKARYATITRPSVNWDWH